MGRPKGSKNKPKVPAPGTAADPAASVPADPASVAPVPKRRGRPPGSKNKPKADTLGAPGTNPASETPSSPRATHVPAIAARPAPAAAPAQAGLVPGASRRRTVPRESVHLGGKLALQCWVLAQFGVTGFKQLATYLHQDGLEGLDDQGRHRFLQALLTPLLPARRLDDATLTVYDGRIVHLTRRINEARHLGGHQPIVWTYFQWLALMFTEAYLDRFTANAVALRHELNDTIAAMNAERDGADRVAPFAEDEDATRQLNKLALWCATGSGKTLLMHVQIGQYLRYAQERPRPRPLNRIILLTPNEGLSRQHLHEFQANGMQAELFRRDGGRFLDQRIIEIIDVHKLGDAMGDKTVDVAAFEGDNLVLVDEGHRGARDDGVWLGYRNRLCADGFSFEYSATFSQALRGSRDLTDIYAKAILLDYSYRWFHGDGYGKQYRILNLETGLDANQTKDYLVACLLVFLQQRWLFREHAARYAPFQIAPPLWVFVGGSVTGNGETSDVVDILLFIDWFTADPTRSAAAIDRVLSTGVITSGNRNVFSGQFAPLIAAGLDGRRLFDLAMALIFQAPTAATLRVERLESADGELALRLGEHPPFGVINVGEDKRLQDLCAAKGLQVRSSAFTGSLFQRLNDDPSLTLLIGSRKFSEGWSSWRVSTLGLMRIGRSEGAQIIQLFGRGVRLKGWKTRLKRSDQTALPPGMERPAAIGHLETLAVFGVKADYMAQFRDFLAADGLPAGDDTMEIVLPVVSNLGRVTLHMPRLKRRINGVSADREAAFQQLGPMPALHLPDAFRRAHPITLNWYPRVQGLHASGLRISETDQVLHEDRFTPAHVALLDLDRLYAGLQDLKAERGWHHLALPRGVLRPLLEDASWYRLSIPAHLMALDGCDRIGLWQDIASALVSRLIEADYRRAKLGWESQHLEYVAVTADDANLLAEGYRVAVDRSQEEIIAKIGELSTLITQGALAPWAFGGLKAMGLAPHLYQPLLYLGDGSVTITPVPLNEGEWRFVDDLREWHNAHAEALRGRQLYLLRNLSKGKGVGFFEAGNFHPDFILWLVDGAHQRIVFIDPKGIRNLEPDDPKVEFHRSVKDIERRITPPEGWTITMEAFIISSTAEQAISRKWRLTAAELESRNVLFQAESGWSYLHRLIPGIRP